MKKAEVPVLIQHLKEMYPDAHCELVHNNPFELLIAVVLSAQCTDKLVNEVTPGLFAKYPKPEDYLNVTQAEMEDAIRRIGLFRNKAKNILETCRRLFEEQGGQVPNDYEYLVSLPGVGRKTANVVLSTAFGVPAIAVDTHVDRLSHRLGLTKAENVLQTEHDLMKKLPKEEWTFTHHALILHGRRVCAARSPKCEICPLQSICDHYKKETKKAAKQTRKKAEV
ncbi:DNA-(apurinic or apyrimidinic site) lyase /endonuclease III [Tumebacillus sp. BK434]|uniref:endonuclease III n=1 Tax=Tumebacillus sp. BK434 TaxID=2512169 RepID=UPI00104E4C7A|nr:endonuclease III [Tumebacillus sp. BK434]TCP59462.1 DNA-(apurinic or apyrimidinic site) lyase /endonuclease III [Tumebacillus sp. BK434]